MGKFSSLHNHSYFSLLDSIVSPADLVQQAYDLGFNAIAITEHGNCHSYIEGYKKAKELGINYIVGVEAYETDDIDHKQPDSKRYHLILLAKSEKGMHNLFKIVSESYLRGFYTKPRVDMSLLEKYHEDIICMSSCLGGRINRIMGHETVNDDSFKKAIEWVNKYKSIFSDDFFLEMQSHDTFEQHYASQNLIKLAQATNTKFTITFDTHMKSKDQMDVHSKFIKVSQDREVGETYVGCYQQDIDEIHATMDKQIGYDNVEKAIHVSDEIANMCNIEIELHQDLMPHIEIPKGYADEQDYLKALVNKGWKERGIHKLTQDQREIYAKRLQEEFEIIDYLGYCSYFIMMKNLMVKMKERNIPVGYGRGSAGGCLILYIIGVTEVDSIKWDLDFSRFANKGRKGSPADIDTDISKNRRKEALEISVELFGKDNVAQLATFNSLSPKVCIRDLGKVFDEEGIYEIPYVIRDKIAKLVPDDPNEKMTIERAMESSSELQNWSQKYPMLFEYTKQLQNIPKSVGTHASAMIVSPRNIIEFSPLMLNKDGNVMLHLEMHNAMDDLGLTKLDLLGLVSLDVIDDTLKFSGLSWEDIDLRYLDLDDRNVFKEVYSKGNTLGIFQMESHVPQKMFADMGEETNIHDVNAISALNRPAILSMGMDKVYIHNKRHPEDVKYIHKDLEPIFKDTQGVCLYQESALKVFALARFDETERDNCRRSIGKKRLDEMNTFYDKFKIGLQQRDWSNNQIEELWELIKAQSSYSFGQAHSTAYGLLSYVMAYLKYHHPVEFMTALLISEIGDYKQLTKYISECKRMNIQVLTPNINESEKFFTIKEKSILFGLLSIKGVGESSVQQIVDERNKKPFNSFNDFYNRVNADKQLTISLIKSGAFTQFEPDKTKLLNQYKELTFERKQYKPISTLPTKQKLYELDIIRTDDQFKNKEKCLADYNAYKELEFNRKQDEKCSKHCEEFESKYMTHPEMYEFSTLSMFIGGHPFDAYIDYFEDINEAENDQTIMLCGTISNIKYRKQRDKRKMADIEVLSLYGLVECRVFANNLVKYQDIIKTGDNAVLLVKKSGDQYLLDKMRTMESWVEHIVKREEKQLELQTT